MLEKMKYRGGEVTDRFLVNFMTHQVSRIEVRLSFHNQNHLLTLRQTCISTLATRHLAIGRCGLYDLDQLRAPMDDVLGALEAQLLELKRYKAKFGELEPEGSNSTSVATANLRKKSVRQSSRASRTSKLETPTNGA
jgi:adenylate cyclase